MSITSCNYAFDAASMALDYRARGSYRLAFDVVSNAIDSPPAILVASRSASPVAVPALWAAYSYQGYTDLYSFAQSFTVSLRNQEATKFLWRITAEYAPLSSGQVAEFTNTNPVLRPAIWSGDPEFLPQVLERDALGNDITNVVKEVFDPPLEQEVANPTVTARWNVPTLAAAYNWMAYWTDTVNSDPWDIFPNSEPRQILCRWGRFGEVQNENGTFYYPMQALFSIKTEGDNWDREILQRGYQHFVEDADDAYDPPWKTEQDPSRPGDTAARRRVRMGTPGVGDLQNLDEQGFLLADAEPGVYTPYRTRREKDFNLMGIPT